MGNAWWGQLSSLLGVVAIVVMLMSRVSRRRLFRRSLKSMDGIGRALGLGYVAPDHARGLGLLRGTYKGYAVHIDPDEQQTISVRFSSAPRVELRSYESTMPTPFDMQGVGGADSGFNRFWKTRRACAALASEVLASATADWVAPFRGRFARSVRSLSVTSDGVTCELELGVPPAVAPAAIPALLEACVQLAARIEPNPAAPVDAVARAAAAANRQRCARAQELLQELAGIAERRFERVLAAVAAVALAGKLWLALSTYGTNDVYAFERFATWGRYLGSGLYVHDSDFNHPPLLLPVLRYLDVVAKVTATPFAFWLRLLPTLADAGTLWLVYQMALPAIAERRVRLGLLLLAASPTLLFISGFHGCIDSIMIALLMLSVYLSQRRASDVAAGLVFGLAASIELVPLVTLPVLVLYRTGWKRRGLFAGVAASAWVLCFVPLALPDLKRALMQVFGHGGQYGHWGVTWLATQLFGPDELPNHVLQSAGVYVLLVLVAGLSWAVSRGTAPLYARVGAVLGLVLAASTSFGVPHLAWLAPWAVGLPVGPALFYALASGGFLLLVYTYWCQGLPWYLADSSRVGDFRGHADYFQLLCWAAVLVLFWHQWRQARGPRQLLWPSDLLSSAQRRALAFALVALVALPCALQLQEEAQGHARIEPSAIGPIRARQYVALSAILIADERYDEGIEVAKRAAVSDPTQPLAWNNLAAGYSSKRNWDRAIAAAERAVQLAPEFTLAQNNLTWAREQKAKSANNRAAEAL